MLKGETVDSGADTSGYTLSKRKVLESGAGFYIGYLYLDKEMGGWLPYSRESGYYRTAEEAQVALDTDDYYRE